jgi:hypothetical protein
MKSKTVAEIDFLELPDGTLLDTIEDANNSAKTQLAIYRDHKVHYADRYETDDRIYAPISRATGILAHVQLARGVTPYVSTNHLLNAVSRTIYCCMDVSLLQGMLLSCFVVSTWLLERLPIAPYVAFVGLPRSGKTTALRVMSLLCRRSLFTSDISSAAFYETCNRVTPTILIDETATAGDQRALFHLLRAGSTKGAVAIRKNKVYNAYGPKVVCWTELPRDAALNSRCLIVPLQESDRTDLRRPTDPKILEHADLVRQMLQQYRLENLNCLSLAPVAEDKPLNSRSRDLYESLALPINDANIRKFLAMQLEDQQDFNREPLSPAQSAVLRALDEHIHENAAAAIYSNKNLTHVVNLDLEANHELLRTSPHEVGRILTTFGLTDRKRTNSGYVLHLTRDMRKKIHGLIRHYRVAIYHCPNRDRCEFCTVRVSAVEGTK